MSDTSDSLFAFRRGRTHPTTSKATDRGKQQQQQQQQNEQVDDETSPITPPVGDFDEAPNILSEYHTLDRTSIAALTTALERVQRHRAKSESSNTAPTTTTTTATNQTPKKRSRLNISFLSRRPSQVIQRVHNNNNNKEQQEANKLNPDDVREENSKLKQRLAKLEMDQLELSSLRHKVEELEWALDVVRDDADKVREDAIAVLSEMEK